MDAPSSSYADGSKSAMNDDGLSPQDALDSFDRLRKSRISFCFASESDAEQWERDGRVEEVREGRIDVEPLDGR